jgi:ATP-dependent protease HslVU (ClpYQ) peptidase subunit
MLRHLEALLMYAMQNTLVNFGNRDVIEPDDGVIASDRAAVCPGGAQALIRFPICP